MTRHFPPDLTAAPLWRQLAGGGLGLVVLLGLMMPVAGIGVVRVALGLLLGVLLGSVLARAALRADATTLGPAGVITLARGVLVVGVAALVGLDGPSGGPSLLDAPVLAAPVALTVLTGLALVLDAVDGPVARRTGTVSALGARFDMETDAVLLLVLAVHVTTFSEPWVLALGLARYVFVAAGYVMPWLRGELPVRRSAKVVAALQGVVLVVTASGLVPPAIARVALAVALLAVVWSFAVSVVWRWRAVDEHPVRWRAAGGALLTTAAAVLVVGILVLPNDLVRLVPPAFLRLPLEVILGAAVLAVLPRRVRTPVALVAGVVLALLGLLKVLDIGFKASLARPFDPVLDWVLLGNAAEYLTGTVGEAGAVVAAVLAVVLALALLAATAGAVVRLGGLAARHRRVTLVSAGLLAVVWLVVWGLVGTVGGQIVRGVPVAAADGLAGIRDRAEQIPAALRDQRAFAAEAANDPYRDARPDQLLTALRGKDVVFAVVESYGRSAIEDPAMAPRIDPILADGDRRLGAAGFGSRSGFLTSPVAGGGSWLAHATLFSGLRIDNQRRYRDLVSSDRLTLTRAFRDAGWETSAVMPGTTRAWPEASFYGHQRVYGADDLGYRGPPFSWSPMPDQYALAAFERLEHARADRGPLMTEIALTSSHAPWTPVPPLLPWEAVGDGSVYAPTAGGQTDFESIWTAEPAVVREHYVQSTAYSLRSLLSWVERFGDDRLVVVVLGDHQPAPMVTGEDASRDVPISVVTRDRAVLDRVGAWGWTPGLEPPPSAPVWPMDDFRDRFLATFAR